MREILFRGKRIDNGEWVEGAYMPHYYSTRHGKVAAIFTNDDVLCKTYRHPVDPATVGQYTGLTDKNGKRIFEGDVIDVVTVDKGEKRRTEVGIGACEETYDDLRCIGVFHNFYGKPVILPSGFVEYTEVIGNIHDNPELLKEEPT